MDIYLNKYYITILMTGKKTITKTKKVKLKAHLHRYAWAKAR
jgi:hypothetical protein